MKIPQYAMDTVEGLKKWITTPECNIKAHFKEREPNETDLNCIRLVGHYGEVETIIDDNVFESYKNFISWAESKNCPYKFKTTTKEDFKLIQNLQYEGYYPEADKFFVENGSFYYFEDEKETNRKPAPFGNMRKLFCKVMPD